MYKCLDCGEEFEEYSEHEEYHPEVHASEYWAVCPHCGSTNFEETEYEEEEDYEGGMMDYIDYMSSSPMTDGEEIRAFFDEQAEEAENEDSN